MAKIRNSSDSLIQAIKERKWHRINQYLDEAKFPDENKSYPLHGLCANPEVPLQIVECIYNAYPEAAMIKDNYEETPIYVAVGAVFEDAVHFLANACPIASSIGDADNCTPIQSAISLLKYNTMIDSMIDTNPGAAFAKDDEGENAFEAFFRHWNVFMRIFLHNHDKISNDALDDYIGYGNWRVRDICHKACLLLKAAIRHRRSAHHSCNLLYCALREECCPPAFSKLLIKLHPDQVLKVDNEGNLPIHAIMACRDLSDENSFLCFDCFNQKSKLVNVDYQNGDSKYCCEDCLERESKQLIKKLLNVRPGK